MKIALLIPIYQPGEKVLPFLKQFKGDEFAAFLIVNDGSEESFDPVFDSIAKETPFEVIGYRGNKGKGNALKEGMKHLLAAHPDLDFILTADSDGQHAYEDILRVENECMSHPDALILGVRDFSQMPKKSKSGNTWMRRYFRFATGVDCLDTQTGLRAIPKNLYPLSLDTYGSRFEYESNFLMAAVKETSLHQITIQTIYEDNNKGTHFRPFIDSCRIMHAPISYVITGLLSYFLDIGLFALLIYTVYTNAASDPLANLYAQAIARSASMVFNFLLLFFWVFHRKRDILRSAWKYLILALITLGISYGLTELFDHLWPELLILKILIDGFLGVLRFFLNQSIVFFSKRHGKEVIL